MKTIVKAKNIIIGKEVAVEIIDAQYNETSVEVKILEGNFAGKCAIVNNNDIVKYEVEVSMEEQLAELCKEMEVEFEYSDYGVVIKGIDYTIFVDVDEDAKEFDLCTLNNNINWSAKADEDVYFEMSSAYKNKVSRKTIKAVKSYIENYVG